MTKIRISRNFHDNHQNENFKIERNMKCDEKIKINSQSKNASKQRNNVNNSNKIDIKIPSKSDILFK